jgi:inosine-uridine nucleoside N-ribohydrolase
MPRTLILDVDTGTDDAVAIMLGALHPELGLAELGLAGVTMATTLDADCKALKDALVALCQDSNSSTDTSTSANDGLRDALSA